MPDLRTLLDEAAGNPPDLPDLVAIRQRGDVLRTRRRVRWAAGAVAAAVLVGGTALSVDQGHRDRLLVPAPQPSGSPSAVGVTNACPAAEPVADQAIAYTLTGPDLTTSVRVMTPGGQAGRCVVDTPGPDAHPAWSPDGRWLAFVGGDGRQDDVYLVRSDGSDLTRLTSTAGRKQMPVWAPDGLSLGYTVTADTGWPSIHVVGRDGLVDRVVLREQVGVMAWLQDWSPDGHTLLFTRDDSPEGGHIALWAMSPSGAEQRLLRAEDGDVGSGVRYSPDGRQLAFQADVGGGCVYRSDPLVKRLTRITAGCTKGRSLSWSPDGTRIVIAGGSRSPTEAVVVGADGHGQRTISTARTVSDVDWRPTTTVETPGLAGESNSPASQ